jgi:DNA-binding transcriptional LysR family regulator
VWDALAITIDVRHVRSFVAVATRLFTAPPSLSQLMAAARELLDKSRLAIEAAEDALAVRAAEAWT